LTFLADVVASSPFDVGGCAGADIVLARSKPLLRWANGSRMVSSSIADAPSTVIVWVGDIVRVWGGRVSSSAAVT
jgi:hypothetical protein